MAYEYEWDEVKNLINQSRHGVDFYDAQEAFDDPKRVILFDAKHNNGEKRFFCHGQTKHGILTVRFTPRADKIRIIGAGYWRQGRKVYEESTR